MYLCAHFSIRFHGYGILWGFYYATTFDDLSKCETVKFRHGINITLHEDIINEFSTFSQ